MKLRAVVLLAGSVRATELSRSIGRSLLDLPIGGGETVLSLWQAQIESLALQLGLESLPIRIIINQSGLAPTTGVPAGRAQVTVEHDRIEYRGTGGVLRDVAERYEADDAFLVAHAAQVMTHSLADIAFALLQAESDVALVSHDDGTPSGLFVLRCGALRDIRSNGFVDFKEQVLPEVAAAGRSVYVLRREEPSGIPVRTLDGYLEGVLASTRVAAGRPPEHDAFEEDWQPSFSIVEKGATVAAGATIHNSVVLSGATVGAGAVVVRSVVCPGAVVRAEATISDRVYVPAGARKAVAS